MTPDMEFMGERIQLQRCSQEAEVGVRKLEFISFVLADFLDILEHQFSTERA